MERPSKRPRLSLARDTEDAPDVSDLEKARSENDLRLKTIFESIFEKYGKDFTDVGDEIDLRTGKVVVNNGHISRMEVEEDTGEPEIWPFVGADVSTSSDGQSQTPAGLEDGSDDDESEIETAADSPDGGEIEVQTRASPQVMPSPNSDTQSAVFTSFTNNSTSWGKVTGDASRYAYLADDDDDDDKSSVDSLLDTALSVGFGNDPQYLTEHIANPGNNTTPKEKPSSLQPPNISPSHLENGREPVDPIWRVPEIDSRKPTTPISSKPRSKPAHIPNTVRSASLPGAGSLWALPSEPRANTDVVKKRRKKEIGGDSRQKSKNQSSPVVGDWEFAEPPDGSESESDDPLQQEYHQPSPTPKEPIHVRAKRTGSAAALDRTKKDHCGYCNRSFSRHDYISHLKSVMSPNGPDDYHSLRGVQKQLDAINHMPVSATNSPMHGSNHDSAMTQNSTPTGHKRPVITPDEARLIIIMRQVQRKKWKDIVGFLPGKAIHCLQYWYKWRWNDRRANPPRLSKPWSQTEQEKLKHLKDQHGLSWSAIRDEFPSRSHAEIEFELLRLWVGEDCKQSVVSSEQATRTDGQGATGLDVAIQRLESVSGQDTDSGLNDGQRPCIRPQKEYPGDVDSSVVTYMPDPSKGLIPPGSEEAQASSEISAIERQGSHNDSSKTEKMTPLVMVEITTGKHSNTIG